MADEELEVQEAVEIVEDHAETQEEIQEEIVDPDYSEESAQRAENLGWKRPEDWRGERPEGFIDNPDRFLERHQKTEDRKAQQEAATEQRFAKLEAMQEKAMQRMADQHQREMADISTKQRAAVELGDVDAYDRLEKEKVDYTPPQAAPTQDPYIAQYMQANEWTQIPSLKQAGALMIESNPAMKNADAKTQLEYAEKEIKRLYPAYFPHDTPKAKPTVTRVDGGGIARGAKSTAFSKLPAEAHSVFKRFVGQGLFTNDEKGKEEYATEYNAG